MGDIDEIRSRALAASPGPWRRHGADVWADAAPAPLFRGRDDSAVSREQADRDAEFVAHAREDVLALIEQVERAAVPPAVAALPAAAGPARQPPRAQDPRVAQADGFF